MGSRYRSLGMVRRTVLAGSTPCSATAVLSAMVAFKVQRCAARGTSGRTTTMANVSIIANEAAFTKPMRTAPFIVFCVSKNSFLVNQTGTACLMRSRTQCAEQVNAAILLPDCARAEPRERLAEQCWLSNSRSLFYAASGPGSSSEEPLVALAASAAADLQ